MSFLSQRLRLGLALALLAPVLALAVPDTLGSLFATAQSRRAALEPVFREFAALPPEARDRRRAALVENLQRQLERASQRTREALVASRKAGKVPEVDVLIIGGGVHGAIAAARFRSPGSQLRVLTVEAGPRIGRVFAQTGLGFRINSPERPDRSTNEIPGAPVRLRQLNRATFATAADLGDVLLFTYAMSPALPLLRQKATRVTEGPEGVEVTLACGVTVRSRALVLATGLGRPRIPFRDPETLELIEQAQLKRSRLGEAPGIETFDAAMRRVAAAIDAGACPLKAYAGKRIGVVGAGDGGNVWIEFLTGLGPAMAYASASVPPVRDQIVWAGQRATTIEAFRAGNKPRYHQTFTDLYASNRLVPVGRHVEKIRPAGGGGYRLEFEGGRTETVDKVVLCTGYRTVTKKLLAGLGSETKLVPIAVGVPELAARSLVARQAVTPGGRRLPVYLVGAGAAPLASPEELAASLTMNAVSIHVLAPRTAAFAQDLGRALSR